MRFDVQSTLSIAVIVAASNGVIAPSSQADTITFENSGIALRGCRIVAIQGGQVLYIDPGGQRQRRPIDQVQSLGFDGLPELDQAESLLAENDYERGLWPLLRAGLKAENDLQRLWVHARLSHIHDLRGEYVQAAGHAARTFALSDDVSWKSLRPVSAVNAPSFPAVRESFENLQSAKSRVKSTELQREIDLMLRSVQDVHDRIASTYDGPRFEPDSTISGFPRDSVLKHAQRPTGLEVAPTSSPEVTPPVVPSATNQRAPEVERQSDPQGADAIDRLLESGDAAEALQVCENIAKNPGDRDLARFLYQFGRALAMNGRKADAAVMLTRCAILYPESAESILATIEVAVIYRDEYRNHATARRLLLQAIAEAQRQEQQSSLMLAQEVLASLPDS